MISRTRDTTQPISLLLEAIESINYRKLKDIIQRMTKKEILKIISLSTKDSSLLFQTLNKWIECFLIKMNRDPTASEQNDSRELNDLISMYRLLVAHGFRDGRNWILLFEDFQLSIMGQDVRYLNMMHHTIGEYVGDDKIQHAVCDYLASFNQEEKLTRYYNTIIKNKILKFILYADIHDRYQICLQQLKMINHPEFPQSLLERPTNLKSNMVMEQALGMNRVSISPYLSECACALFNRFEKKRRPTLEKNILSNTVQLFPPDSTPVLNYMSLGFGGGLQDFILVGKLLLAGYQSIQVVLIDSGLRKDSLRQFKELNNIAARKNATLQIMHFHSIGEYVNEHPALHMHVISAIDFENILKTPCFSDVILAHKMLTPDVGRFYFSFTRYDFCLSSAACLNFKNHRSPQFINRAEKLIFQASSLNVPVIEYVCMGLESQFAELVALTHALSKKSPEKICLTLLQPKIIGYFEDLTGDDNVQLNEENLTYFLKLFVAPATEISVSVHHSLISLQAEVDQSPNQKYLITCLEHTTKHPEETERLIAWMKDKNPEILCYAIADQSQAGPESGFEEFTEARAGSGLKF